MDLNELEMRDQIARHQIEIFKLEVELVFIWIANHNAAQVLRYERYQRTSYSVQCTMMRDVVQKLKQHQERLLRSLEIGLSVTSKSNEAIEQISKNENADVVVHSRIESYQQELTKFPKGSAWVSAFKNAKEIDQIDSEEKGNLLALQNELENEKKQHKIEIRKLKKDIEELMT